MSQRLDKSSALLHKEQTMVILNSVKTNIINIMLSRIISAAHEIPII